MATPRVDCYDPAVTRCWSSAPRFGPAGLALALGSALVGACSGHRRSAETDDCASAIRDPALFKRVQGVWAVRFADFERGQKPPGKTLIGALTLAGCRYSFTPAPAVAEVGSFAWREYPVARTALPIVATPHGRLEILDPSAGLGGLALIPDGAAAGWEDEEMGAPPWRVTVHQRPQEGEFLYFAPTDQEEAHRWEISRGVFRLRADEYIPSSDPEGQGRELGVLGRMREGLAP